MARIRLRGTSFGVLAIAVTSVFAVLAIGSLVYPPIHVHLLKNRLKRAAVAALPAGTEVTGSAAGGSGSLQGVAAGHLATAPKSVLASAPRPGGSLGWSPVGSCGNSDLCYLSREKNFVLTLHVEPCVEQGCPPGGSLVSTTVSKGGPRS